MKVLMLGWELPPHNSGGLGVVCYYLCKALAKRDVSIDFILPYAADHDIDFMKITAATPHDVAYVMKMMSTYDSYKFVNEDGRIEWRDITDQQKLYEIAVGQIVAEQEYDIIHAHDWLTFRAALRAKEVTGCPLIAHVHSVESDRAGGHYGNPLVHDIEEMMCHMADRIVAVSGYTRQALVRDYGIPASKIDVVYNCLADDAVTLSDQTEENAHRYLTTLQRQGWKVVASVGRLTVMKGIPNLLRAIKLVVEHQPKTMFLIVGNGEQYLELIQMAADLGIAKNVMFTGFLRGKVWRDAFSAADLFVMPSVSEPFGLVAVEAVTYGTPTLVSKQSGVVEVMHSTLKVDFWDVDEMASQLIAAVRDEPLRKELLSGATKELANLTWQKAADQFVELYNRQLAVGAVV